MFFTTKPTVLIHISRDGFIAYSKKGASKRLAFPPEVFHNLEVLDAKQLASLTTVFAAENSLRGQRIVLLLDDEVVFQKILPKTDNVQNAKADFENKVPFDPGHRKVIMLQPKDQLVLLGTNKVLYETIASALTGVGAKVLAVTPIVVYGKLKGPPLSLESFEAIIKGYPIAQAANFIA